VPRSVLLSFALLLAVLLGGCGAAGTGAPTGTGTRAGGAAATPRATVPAVPAGFAGGTIGVGQLPAEARETLALMASGGPFPYSQDGVVFQNREGLLPARPRGTYHEYTVVTPGSADRGARRLIVSAAGERYYTDDHYASFRFVVGQ
jgi:ribonuclease T1